jgi:hypothetical protein
MKSLKVLPFIISAAFITGCSNIDHVENYSPESKLYGSWNCKLSIEEEEVKLSMDYVVTYIRNGKSNGFGYLVESTIEIKLVNVSHPDTEDVWDLENMLPQNISESSEVLVLNNSLLKVKSESDGTIYSCNKVANKS